MRVGYARRKSLAMRMHTKLGHHNRYIMWRYRYGELKPWMWQVNKDQREEDKRNATS